MIGRITKTHGYAGTVVLVSDRLLDNDLESLDEVFILIDGLRVPFPVIQFVLITDTLAHVQLEFVCDQNEAQKLVGCELFSAAIPVEQETEAGLEQWIGFAVHDSKYGNIGFIREIEDYNGNIVIHIVNGGKETLISLFPELVTGIDDDTKTLYITAPEGYF